MLFELILITTIALTNLFIGFFVLLKNPKNSANRFFAGMCVCASLWTVIVVLENVIQNQNIVIFLNKIDFTLGPFILYFLLLFCKSFGRTSPISFRQHLLILFFPLFFSSLSLFSNLLVDHIEFRNGHPLLIRGPLYPLMTLYFYVYVGLSLAILISKYRKFFGIKKRQLFYILFGLFGTAFFWLTGSFISLYLTYYQKGILSLWSRYSIYAIFLSTFFFAYAIARYRFMDLKIVIRRQAINLFLLTLSLGIYTFLVFWLEKILEKNLNINPFLTIFVSMVVVIFGFPLWKNLIWKFSNKFIPEKYNFQKILSDLKPQITETAKLEELFKIIDLKLKQILGIEKAYLFFISKNKIKQYPKETKLEITSKISFLCNYFKKEDKILVTQEIPFILEEKPLLLFKSQEAINLFQKIKTQKTQLKEIEKMLKEIQIEIVIPLKFDKKLLGILFLGPKIKGDIFTSEELTFLENLKNNLSQALQNILLYQQAIERIKE